MAGRARRPSAGTAASARGRSARGGAGIRPGIRSTDCEGAAGWLDEHEHWNGIDDPTDAKSGTAESGSGSGAGPPDGATANVLDATDHVPDATAATVAAASCRAGGRGAAATCHGAGARRAGAARAGDRDGVT